MFSLKNLLIVIGRNALISLGAVLVATVAIFFIANRIQHLSDSVVLNHRLEAKLQKRTSLIEVLKRDAQIVGANDAAIENAFASSDNILGFINTFDTLASKNSLTQIYSFETPIPSAVSAPFPIFTIAYSNRFDTTLRGFTDYLKQFNHLPYYTKIDGFNISSQDKIGWVGASTITYRATLYTRGVQ